MNTKIRSLPAILAAFTLAAASLVFLAAAPVGASQPSTPGPSSTLPNAVPSASTPAVNNGRVFGIAQVGEKMVIGGSFTSVGGQTRNHIAAFDTSSGALSSSFAPSVNGDVNAVIPGPNNHTVYIGGNFTQVGSKSAQFIALVDLNTGQPVAGFDPPAFNYGYISDLVKRGDRLYLAGTFTKAGGRDHARLAALDATTGALDPFMGVQLDGHHNDTGSGAQGWIGPWDADVSPDGHTMVATGNFKYADGLLRDQVVMIDLTGSTAQVKTDWATNRYSPQCYNWAFDGYVRGISFSPDGSYFVINATGGGNQTLCDATARFETGDTGTDIQPTWVNETGGDTVWGVTVTDTAVYVGGHNRWSNNPAGVDQAQPGAVPRPGLGALDPVSGRPFTWNPGRRPLGVAVFAMLATPEGLWIGSNNDYIGNFRYKRPKLAFFPYSGGYSPTGTSTATLPGTVYLAGSTGSGQSNILYRMNAGGGAIQASDNGPDWASDDSDPSDYRNNGSNAAGWAGGATQDGTVPATTPSAIFDSERWSPSDNPAMDWSFPVKSGTPLKVKLYFANRCTCTSGAGQRAFDVSIDGSTVLNDYDIVSDVGDQRGTTKSFDITSDGTVNIDFAHVVENPLINGIEILRTDVSPPPSSTTDTLTSVAFDGTTATSSDADNQDVDFGHWRGAFAVGNKVYYGYTDSFLYSRTFNGSTFGPAVKVDPYNDPDWSDVSTDLGQTFRGVVPSLYGQLPNVTSMVYANGKLYYTLFGDSSLRWRWFSPDSGIIDERSATVSSSVNFSEADGIFVDGGNLYYVSRADGNLRRVLFDGSSVSGSPTVVSGPSVDGVNWKNRAMFLQGGGAPPPPPNVDPTAAFTSDCTDLDCAFDASGSSDDDGSIASYSWDFGDGETATGRTPEHTFDAADTYAVKLTVTDNDGATDSVEQNVTVTTEPPVASALDFVASAHGQSGNRRAQQVTVPNGVGPGDTMLLFLSHTTPSDWTSPDGWTEVDTYAHASLTTTVWRKTATASDAGSSVKLDASGYTHASLNLAAYSGVDASDPVAAATQTGETSTSSHDTPNVTAGAGDWVVSYWTERSSTTNAWTAPSGVATRDSTSDTGGLRVSALIADSDSPVSTGSYGGLTATTDGTSDRAVMWSIALNTAS